jgi:integrase
MPVRVTRQRKPGGVWYAGGTVRVGKEVREVAEYSTGSRSRADADHIAATRDGEIRREIQDGPAGRARSIQIIQAIDAYLDRPGGVKAYDVARLYGFGQFLGHRPIAYALPAWQDWLRAHSNLMPATIARSRATLQAALNHGAEALSIPPPRLPGVRGAGGVERVVYLTDDERRRLLASYNAHAACPVLVLAYQGFRTQEALRMDWRHVAFGRREIVVPAEGTKTGKGRTVPMHAKTDRLLFGMWCAAGKPDSGPVFLSVRGEPYADTRGRDGGRQGGNSLSRAHATACAAAGIVGFRVHDWRHDFATRWLMSGGDILTLQRICGWSSPRMVQRYATTTADHMAKSLRQIA